MGSNGNLFGHFTELGQFLTLLLQSGCLRYLARGRPALENLRLDRSDTVSTLRANHHANWLLHQDETSDALKML